MNNGGLRITLQGLPYRFESGIGMKVGGRILDRPTVTELGHMSRASTQEQDMTLEREKEQQKR